MNATMNPAIFSIIIGLVFIVVACLIFRTTRPNKNISLPAWLQGEISIKLPRTNINEQNIHERLAMFYQRIIRRLKIGSLYIMMILSLYAGILFIIAVWVISSYSIAALIIALIIGALWALYVFGYFYEKMILKVVSNL